MPLNWQDVTKTLDPTIFTVRSAPALLRKSGAWDDYDRAAASLQTAIDNIAGTTALAGTTPITSTAPITGTAPSTGTAPKRNDAEFNSSGEMHMARKYSKAAGSKVEKAMHERKAGTLKSGRSGKKVKSRKQAIAIGLSEARRAGKKVPKKKAK
jgi:hypothetical protein